MLVEPNPNAGMLSPVRVPLKDALSAGISQGFSPNGIPADISADPVMEPPGGGNFVDEDIDAA